MIHILKQYIDSFLGNQTGILRKIPLFFILLLLPYAVFSQDATPADTLEPDLKVLKVSQVPFYVNTSGDLIKNISELTEQQKQLDDIKSDLPDVEAVIAAKIELLNDSVVYKLNRLDVENRELSLIRPRLDEWESLVQDWSKDAQLKTKQIDSLMRLGIHTLDSIAPPNEKVKPDSDTLQVDSSRIKVVAKLVLDLNTSISKLDTASVRLDKWIDEVQRLDNTLAITISDFNQANRMLEDKREEVVQQIWIPEYPPIWERAQDSDYLPSQTSLATVYQKGSSISRRFLKNNRDVPYQAGFTFFLILGSILYLRFNSSNFYGAFPEQLNESRIILDRPVFSSMILTWFSIAFFVDLPIELSRFIALIMLIPLAFMFWAMDKDRAWYKVLIFIVFSLLFVITPVLNYFPSVQRFALLFIEIGAFLILLWVKSKPKLIDDVKDLWFGFLPFTIRLFMILSLLGILGNILGALQLSQLLTMATLGTFLFFIIYSESILLLRALICLVLLGPLFKKSLILKEDSKIVIKKLNRLLKFVGFVFWVYVTLSLLTIRNTVWNNLLAFINTPFNVGEVSISIGNVLAFFITIQIALWLSSFIRYILNREIFPRTQIKTSVSSSISMIIRYSFIILGIIMALGAAGIPFDKLTIAVGAIGVGVGFGLQHLVNNFISGIILALERPIHIGDTVEVDSVQGIVKDIGFRASLIQTWDGAEVIIPNGKLLSESLMNRTLSNRRRRLTVDVRVPFDSDIEAVERILLETTKNQPEIMQDPGPYTNFEGIGESAMKIKVYFWIENTSDLLRLANSVRIAVYNALQKAGFQIPVPKSDVHIENK